MIPASAGQTDLNRRLIGRECRKALEILHGVQQGTIYQM